MKNDSNYLSLHEQRYQNLSIGGLWCVRVGVGWVGGVGVGRRKQCKYSELLLYRHACILCVHLICQSFFKYFWLPVHACVGARVCMILRLFVQAK